MLSEDVGKALQLFSFPERRNSLYDNVNGASYGGERREELFKTEND
jgi:hypothetical protein